eukprot:SAG11_NODE_857_length_6851_cov_2.438981_6_plen_138_part_00
MSIIHRKMLPPANITMQCWKCILVPQLLDIHFNPLLFKLLCAHDPAHMPTMLGLADIEELDSHLFTSLSKMDALAAQYAAIEADVAISADDKAAAIGALRYDGVMVDDLSLDFTCPVSSGFKNSLLGNCFEWWVIQN